MLLFLRNAVVPFVAFDQQDRKVQLIEGVQNTAELRLIPQMTDQICRRRAILPVRCGDTHACQAIGPAFI